MNRKTSILAWTTFLTLVALSPRAGQAQQPLIQITSPTANTLFTEGTTVTITVSADPSVTVVGVIPQYPLPEVVATATPNQYTLAVPATAPIPPGLYNLTAIGNNASGDVESAPVAIDVEFQYLPPISVNPPVLTLDLIGDQFPMHVIATPSGGGAIDVTNSTQLSFGSGNTQIATVSSLGIVTATGPGQTYIAVQEGGGIVTAMVVIVPQQPPTGTPPSITGISPTNGVPGSQVTVSGSGFGSAQSNGFVQLGTQNGNVISWSDTQIAATASSGSASGSVTVNQNGLFSNAVPFSVNAPVIQGISPAAWSPGVQVTITGSGFGATATPSGSGVYLGGTWPSIVSWSNSQIVFTVPAGIGPGSVLVEQNYVDSNAVNYTMIPPVLTSVSPTSWSPGMQVTLTGSGFGPSQNSSGSGVYLGGQPSALRPQATSSANQLTLTSP